MPESFTCPRCGRTSHNPTDVAEGYCGACHAWTRDDPFPLRGEVPDDELPTLSEWLAAGAPMRRVGERDG